MALEAGTVAVHSKNASFIAKMLQGTDFFSEFTRPMTPKQKASMHPDMATLQLLMSDMHLSLRLAPGPGLWVYESLYPAFSQFSASGHHAIENYVHIVHFFRDALESGSQYGDLMDDDFPRSWGSASAWMKAGLTKKWSGLVGE